MNSTLRSRVMLAHRAAGSPAGGTTTPASPWIGSMSTATVFSSIAASSAAASPYGTVTEPGRVRAEVVARVAGRR